MWRLVISRKRERERECKQLIVMHNIGKWKRCCSRNSQVDEVKVVKEIHYVHTFQSSVIIFSRVWNPIPVRVSSEKLSVFQIWLVWFLIREVVTFFVHLTNRRSGIKPWTPEHHEIHAIAHGYKQIFYFPHPVVGENVPDLGRWTGYIATWCWIANEAADIGYVLWVIFCR